MPVGERIKFKLLRESKEFELTILVDEGTSKKTKPKVTSELLIGVTVSDIQKGSPYFGRIKGVLVLEIQRGSRAWTSGLRANDVITSVNKNPIKNLDEFLSAVDKKEDALLLRIVRGNMATFIVIKK